MTSSPDSPRSTKRHRVRDRQRSQPEVSQDEETGVREQQPPLLLAPREGIPPVTSSPHDIIAAAQRIAAGHGPLAVDAERASGFRYWPKAYLVQMRREGSGTVLLDPIPHPHDLAPLAESVNGLEWVLHAADQDLPCLAELGLHPASLFDTELGGRIAGCERVGLAALVESLLGVGLTKGHGGADWSQRPLPAEWLNYAALDVELLLPLKTVLAELLESQGKSEWAYEEFDYIRRRPVTPHSADRWRRTGRIHEARGRRQLAMVREMWLAREQLARERDVATGRVLPDSAIMNAARHPPLLESLRDDAHHAEEPSERSHTILRGLPIFSGPNQSKVAHVWLAALFHAVQLPDAALPPLHPPVAPHDLSARKGRNPTEVALAKEALHSVSQQHNTPLENLLSPEIVRRVCAWIVEQDTLLEDLSADQLTTHIEDLLTRYGARQWQIFLTARPLATAFLNHHSVAVTPTDDPQVNHVEPDDSP